MPGWLGRVRDEHGSHLPELAIAMLVLSVVLIGTAGTLASSLTYVGGARQRSAGTAVATERLENLPRQFRSMEDFAEAIALTVRPEHDPDSNEPNHSVTAGSECGGTAEDRCYLVEGEGPELLLAPPSREGNLLHVEDPVTLGSTEFHVHQYATCPGYPQQDEDACDPEVEVDDQGDEVLTWRPHHRRVIVVVTWKFPVNSGPSNRVTQSTLVSVGTITVNDDGGGQGGEPTPTPDPTPTPEPTPPPEPTLLPDGTCPDNFEPLVGSLQVLSGSGQEGFHGSPNVQVRLEVDDSCLDEDGIQGTVIAELRTEDPEDEELPNWVEVANMRDPELFDEDTGSWDPVTTSWTVPAREDTYIIHARFRDGNNNSSDVYTAQVILDTGPPTAPRNFDIDISQSECSGNQRELEFIWDESSDSGDPENPGPGNLVGYRLYRSVNNAPFEVVTTSASTSATDSHRKTENSVRFIVRAYDKAGNESGDSSVISFAKNECP